MDAEGARDHLGRGRHHRAGVPVDGLPHPGDDVLPGPADRAVQHEQPGVEQGAEVGQRPADGTAEVAQQPLHADVARLGQADHDGIGEPLLVGGLGQVDRLGADRPDQAAAAAAGAHRAVVPHLHVRELAREAPGAPVQPAADDQAGSDAGLAELHVHLVRLSLPGAERVLAERAEVGVVLDQHAGAGLPGQRVGQFLAGPGRPAAGPADLGRGDGDGAAHAALERRRHAQHHGGQGRDLVAGPGAGLP